MKNAHNNLGQNLIKLESPTVLSQLKHRPIVNIEYPHVRKSA